MISINSILVLSGFTLTILIAISTIASSIPPVKSPEELGKISGLYQDANLAKLGSENSSDAQIINEITSVSGGKFMIGQGEKAVTQNKSENPIEGAKNSMNADLDEDETLSSLNGDEVEEIMADFNTLHQQQHAKANLRNLKLIIKVCAQLSRDIAWSQFKENYSRVNPFMSEERMDKYRATLQNDSETDFDEYYS